MTPLMISQAGLSPPISLDLSHSFTSTHTNPTLYNITTLPILYHVSTLLKIPYPSTPIPPNLIPQYPHSSKSHTSEPQFLQISYLRSPIPPDPIPQYPHIPLQIYIIPIHTDGEKLTEICHFYQWSISSHFVGRTPRSRTLVCCTHSEIPLFCPWPSSRLEDVPRKNHHQ